MSRITHKSYRLVEAAPTIVTPNECMFIVSWWYDDICIQACNTLYTVNMIRMHPVSVTNNIEQFGRIDWEISRSMGCYCLRLRSHSSTTTNQTPFVTILWLGWPTDWLLFQRFWNWIRKKSCWISTLVWKKRETNQNQLECCCSSQSKMVVDIAGLELNTRFRFLFKKKNWMKCRNGSRQQQTNKLPCNSINYDNFGMKWKKMPCTLYM